MVFSDLFFIFVFLPAFLLCYMIAYFVDKKMFAYGNHPANLRNVILVLFSLIFYAWGEPIYVFLMLFSVFVNYFSGLAIGHQEKRRKAALVVGLACNILLLGTFKYAVFFATTLANVGIPVGIPKISLPIGISFYTFQSISYLVDVYRKEAPAQRRFIDLLLYISMFPQLIAGPIVRYDIVALEIKDCKVTQFDLVEGIYRFLIGLGKKVILANQFSEIADQFLSNGLNNLSTFGAWVGVLAYTLQIFFDFSGYSDMAIGLGRCLGFHFAENFKHPYCCTSITDFWRKWHMSLGSFFRDYVYIPLGGNRRHQPFNILVVWFLTGMWHGASWNFIIWGLYFGFFVLVEKYTLLKVIDRIPRFFLHIYSMVIVVIGWGVFYFDDFGKMQHFFHAFFFQAKNIYDFAAESACTGNFWLWVMGILFCLPVYDFVSSHFNKLMPTHTEMKKNVVLVTRTVISVILLVLSVALLVGATNNAFIYTRF